MASASDAPETAPDPGLDPGKCCAYGHVADGQDYLADGLFPDLQRLPLAVGQNAASVLAEIAPGTRWFAWHVFTTYKHGIPPDREALCAGLRERGLIPINEGVADGSKHYMQALLAELGLPTATAAREGDPDELLFVKSNYNFGGLAEKRLTEEVRGYFGIALPHRLSPQFNAYQVAPRRRIVPLAFELEDVIVERYVGNASEVFYRAFVVFDAVVLSRLVCRDVIKKALEAEQREDYFLSFADAGNRFASAPDALARRIMSDLYRFCRAFKLDMGGIDILLDEDGLPHIVDVNPTAYGGANLDRPGLHAHLIGGLRARAEQAVDNPV